jgi:hypothetical protein
MALPTSNRRRGVLLAVLAVSLPALIVWRSWSTPSGPPADPPDKKATPPRARYKPRHPVDTSGFVTVAERIPPWPASASLDRVASAWRGAGPRLFAEVDAEMKQRILPADALLEDLFAKAALMHYEGEPERAYAVLEQARRLTETDPTLTVEFLYTVIAFQGVSALRWGETENCVLCRGESSCIIPLVPAAVHLKPNGSRLAIKHFTEYLNEFPDDLEIRWLLNLAHMTLGDHPSGVDPRFRISLDRFTSPEHGIGKFRDIGHLVGINRLNQAGGVILDDFDNDGLLDIVFTSFDPTASMVFYRNKGDGTFEDRTKEAGLSDQLGGLNCVQADYNNDGFLDIYIPRGAWLQNPVRPTLLRNNGNGTFTDVTLEAGLLDPMNSIAAQWADYDNDGFLDLFVCNETGPCRLYHNKGDGTFEEVAVRAGVAATDGRWKGVTWIDFDGDRFPDLFVNNLSGPARLYRNNGNGTFTDVTTEMGINGPEKGFSCWAFDYDNDGWPDIFATSYDRTVEDVVKGLLGQPHARHSNKLYRNLGGKRFQDVTKETGLDLVFATMGSNFGDLDNDGYLDFYLGTGDPQLSMLVPKRLFRNLGGKRFAEITGSSGTGHLQKGHGIAFGDWRRCGSVDIVMETGGAVNGDRYHNVLFQNPGQGNNWLNVKLVGKKTNRAAIGARIKAVTAGENPQTVYRWVCSGSSFGANPLEQHIGLGKAERIARLEIYWPTSGTTQVFTDVAVNQGILITEFDGAYVKRPWSPLPLPK